MSWGGASTSPPWAASATDTFIIPHSGGQPWGSGVHRAVPPEAARESLAQASPRLPVPEIFGAPPSVSSHGHLPVCVSVCGFLLCSEDTTHAGRGPILTKHICDSPVSKRGPFGGPGVGLQHMHIGGMWLDPDRGEAGLLGSPPPPTPADGRSVARSLLAGPPTSASLAGLGMCGGFRSFFSCPGTPPAASAQASASWVRPFLPLLPLCPCCYQRLLTTRQIEASLRRRQMRVYRAARSL